MMCKMRPFYEVKGVPTHSVVLLSERDAALAYPTGDIRLGFCETCGFISNLAYDPRLQDYSTDYESTQSYSPTFDAFSRQLAGQLIERYDLRRKTILEIGCGMGEFLTLLCELGDNRGIGFDPSYRAGRLSSPSSGQVQFIRDYYSESYQHYRADFIVCKMTLEHIHKPDEFVQMIRRAIADSPDTIVFFQVPDVTRILREIAFWDVYYEHCSYFSPGSLARLFRRSGFEVVNLYRDYGDQYVMIEARPGCAEGARFPNLEEEVSELARSVAFFEAHVQSRLDAWQQFARTNAQAGRKVVLWGAGSKGVAFLTTLGVHDEIEYCVDVNPHKHGSYMAGTGQQIIAPDQLREYRPEAIIAMNPIYRSEIARMLAGLGLNSQLITVNDTPKSRRASFPRILESSKCPVCTSTDVWAFLTTANVPVHCNRLWASRESAINAPRADLRLGCCRACGHIFNTLFDPALVEYTVDYENSLHFSPRFQDYAVGLAHQLIERYQLQRKTIIEIGCGKGEFLSLLCELGDNQGIGFDPAYLPESELLSPHENIRFIRDTFTERHADLAADLICARHVLEHIPEPRQFLTHIRNAIGDQQTGVFFEVPNAMYMLRQLAIWDIIYEHVSYFSPASLSHVFQACGFAVQRVSETFGGQFLTLEGTPRSKRSPGPTSRLESGWSSPQQWIGSIDSFADSHRHKVAMWRTLLEQTRQKGQRVVVWGSGSKGVTFLNTFRDQSPVEFVVDINPRKQGMFVGGSGQRIVPPDFLRRYQPNIIILMNPLYAGEIGQTLERMDLLEVELLKA